MDYRWNKVARIALLAVGTAMVAYQATYAVYMTLDNREFLLGHLGFALVILYLIGLKGARTRLEAGLNIAMMLVSMGVIVYLFIFFVELQTRGEYFTTPLDTIVGTLLILLVLEATRKQYGWVLPSIALLLFLYGLFGSHLPGSFQARHTEASIFISKLTTSLGDSGMFGVLLSVSALYIFLFMLFAAFLQESKTVAFFEELGKLVSGRFRSGPALAAIVTSSLVGSVSGQVGANVAITGSYTIPAMKAAGYKPEQAGGIESAASTCGPIVPPVMGVAAFIMSGMTGIAYSKIIIVAVIPALFYVICAGINVELSARRMDIQGLVGKPNMKELFYKMPIFLIALGLIIFLFSRGAPPLTVGFWASILVMALSMIRKETRLNWRNFLAGFERAAELGSGIAATCATLGIVVGTLIITGLVIKLPMMIGDLCGGNLVLLLLMTGVTSIILGCGLPPSASYILVAIVLVPLLLRHGVPLLSAHYFTFYFANFSFITPPVAIAAVFASRLADANYMRTSVEAVKVGIAGFFLPFMIVWAPGFIGDFSQPFLQVLKLAVILLMLLPIQMFLVGYLIGNLGLVERSLAAISALSLFVFVYNNSLVLLVLGILALVVVVIWQWGKTRRTAQPLRENIEKRV